MWLKEIKWRSREFGQTNWNYKKKSSENSKMENAIEIKNWMDVFNSRIDIQKRN